jgi:hypothetical protein
MKILVMSDTHGRLDYAKKVIEKFQKKDLEHVIHCGDYLQDAISLQQYYPEILIHAVPGNCDFSTHGLDRHQVIEIDGIRIFWTHGDRHHVKSEGYEEIWIDTLSYEAQVGVCGHTHCAYLEKREGGYLLNPGSLTSPRDTLYPSFGVIEIERGHIKAIEVMVLVEGDRFIAHPNF